MFHMCTQICFTFAVGSDMSKCVSASCVNSIFPLQELSIFANCILLFIVVVSFDYFWITDLHVNTGDGGVEL